MYETQAYRLIQAFLYALYDNDVTLQILTLHSVYAVKYIQD